MNKASVLGFGTAVFAGLSQISDESSAPSKPLFFYLVPLVKIRELLRQATDLAENGYWDDLTVVVNQITRQNDARGNLFAAAAYLSGKDEERAKQMAFDFLELLEKVDYNKYFESMKGVPVSGAKAAEYSRFSKKAAVAAAAKLDEFLRLMDREQLDAATPQVVAFQTPAEPVAEKTVEESPSEPVVAEAGEPAARSFSDGYAQ